MADRDEENVRAYRQYQHAGHAASGDPKWADIFARPLPGYASAPTVQSMNIHHPTCPEHCRRHETDGVMQCPKCGGVKYRVLAHEWLGREGHYWNSVEPMNGAPPYRQQEATCCGRSLVRTF